MSFDGKRRRQFVSHEHAGPVSIRDDQMKPGKLLNSHLEPLWSDCCSAADCVGVSASQFEGADVRRLEPRSRILQPEAIFISSPSALVLISSDECRLIKNDGNRRG